MMNNLVNNQNINFNNILHFYLWVSQGENVSSNRNYYPIETKFAALTFYSQPFEKANEQFLLNLEKGIISQDSEGGSNDICKLITGSCPIIPIINKDTKQKLVYLPSLTFYVNPPANKVEEGFMGLYYFSLIKTDVSKCKVIENEKILSHADLLNLQTYTYSTIFQKVLKNCAEKKIDPDNVMLGIYTSQSRYEKYIPEYNQTDITNLIPKYANISLEHASTLNSINDYSENVSSFPCFIIDNNVSSNWTPLGNIKTQGCGLNILSYYGIIPPASTREEISCLSMKGTSIFRILDYINKYYFIQKYNLTNMEFFILRAELKFGLTIIINFMKGFKTNNKYAILFRLYSRDKYPDPKKGEITSDIGHSSSIACYNDEIRYIDPIYEINTLLQGTKEEQVNQAYHFASQGSSFKIIDIIFIYNNNKKIDNSTLPTTNKSELEQEINYGNCFIRARPVDLFYGGKNKKKKNKTRQEIKKKNKTRQEIKKRKNKTKKYIYSKNTRDKKYKKKNRQYGGYDTFEEVMLNIDKKNGVNSNIVLQS